MNIVKGFYHIAYLYGHDGVKRMIPAAAEIAGLSAYHSEFLIINNIDNPIIKLIQYIMKGGQAPYVAWLSPGL